MPGVLPPLGPRVEHHGPGHSDDGSQPTVNLSPPLVTPLDALPLAVVDVETTGLAARNGDRVCEIAVLRVEAGRAPVLLDELVNPGRPIGSGASRVNGITDEDVADAQAFGQLIPAVNTMLSGAVFVAHNAPFDLSFLAAEYAAAGAELPVGPVACTLALARRHFRFASNSLGNLARSLGVPPSRQAHRAGGDVETTLGVFRAILEQLRAAGCRDLGDLLAAHGAGPAVSPQTIGAVPAPALPEPLARALASNGRVTIRYSDQRLRITERVVRPIAVRHNRLVAYCYLRQAERTFQLERIEAVWEVE